MTKARLVFRSLLLLLPLALVVASSAAQELAGAPSSAGQINYAYALGGTGFFSIGGQSTQVARIPLSHQFRSVHDLEIRDRLGRGVKESVETVALAIGTELEFQMRDNWRLEPYAETTFPIPTSLVSMRSWC